MRQDLPVPFDYNFRLITVSIDSLIANFNAEVQLAKIDEGKRRQLVAVIVNWLDGKADPETVDAMLQKRLWSA